MGNTVIEYYKNIIDKPKVFCFHVTVHRKKFLYNKTN